MSAQPPGMATATRTLAATPSPFAVFRNRNFTLLWSGQLVSTIGSALTSLAASILVYNRTQSAFSVGLMLMATAVPSVVLGLIAGVFVDRFDRKRIMLVSDLLRAGLVFLIPFLVARDIVWLYIIVLLTSAISQFFEPAQSSVLPEVATDEELTAANSLMAISSFGSTAVGFAAAGFLAAGSIDLAFYIDSATFIFSALCIALVRIAPFASSEVTNIASILRNMRSGMQYLFGTPILRSAFVIFPAIGLSLGLWNALLLPFAKTILNANEFQYGLQEGLTSVGFVVGSLLMARLAERLREGQWLTVSFLGMGLFGLIYVSLSSIPLALAIVGLFGLANAPYIVARGVLIQRHTPREMRGRVMSVFFVTRDVMFVLGMAAAGLADVWGVRELMFVSALLVLIPGVLALFLPGLGQPAAEWRRAVNLLRGAATAPRLGAGRPATAADFDMLIMRVPSLAGLNPQERNGLIASARVIDAPPGTTILRVGDKSDAAYFVLAGRAVAGIESDHQYRALETMSEGDFFGEIAALTGSPRTANVIAAEPTTLLQVPGMSLRHLVETSSFGELVRNKFIERATRTNLHDLPRFAGFDQQTLRELRTPEASSAR